MWGFETQTRSFCAGVYGAALSFHRSRDTVCNIDVRVSAEFGAIDGGAMGVAEEVDCLWVRCCCCCSWKAIHYAFGDVMKNSRCMRPRCNQHIHGINMDTAHHIGGRAQQINIPLHLREPAPTAYSLLRHASSRMLSHTDKQTSVRFLQRVGPTV